MNISVIGLGKLGAPLACWIASKGHNVIGVDVNGAFVDAIRTGSSPIDEPGLDKLLAEMVEADRLTATLNHKQAILDTDITFIVVPTPSTKTGEFSIEWVKQAAAQIGLALNQKASYHLVVIVSTVMPGHTQVIADAIQSYSLKECGKDFGVVYNPEFIALGSVLHDLEHPDFVLIGQSDDRAGEALCEFYRDSHGGTGVHRGPKTSEAKYAPIYRTSFINAEIAKLALNCYVTMKISYANMIGRVCETIPGADADEVTAAIGLDSRIGKKYLKAGTPFGGPCFPRDNEAFMAIMDRTQMSLPMATKAENMLTLARITNLTLEYSTPGDVVGIVGISYKIGTIIGDQSAGIKLQNALERENRQTLTWDGERVVATIITPSASFGRFVAECDVVIIMLPYEALNKISNYHFAGKVILDPWRCINSDTLPEDCVYIPMGRHHVG